MNNRRLNLSAAESLQTAQRTRNSEDRPNSLPRRLSRNWWRRSDARSTAVLFSTSGAMPLPALALLSSDFLKPGAMPLLMAVWTWTVLSFITTLWMGKLTDRAFAILGFVAMIGIAASAYIVNDPAAARAIVTLLSAIPAIAAMASSPRVVFVFTTIAIVLATVVSIAEATSFAAGAVGCGVGVVAIAIPVFMVAALRQSLESALRRTARLAEIDPLTGLLNRRGLYTRTEATLLEAARHGQMIGCALIDIDHFKSVNDRRGHACGDAVLVDTVETIRATLSSEALVARLGGEEFLILCPTTSASDWNDVIESIRLEVEQSDHVTVSAGVVTAPVIIDSTDAGSAKSSAAVVDELCAAADTMLYRAKSGGRNLVVGEVVSDARLDVKSVEHY